MTNNLAYGVSGHRDEEKQMEDLVIRHRKGRIHFIRSELRLVRIPWFGKNENKRKYTDVENIKRKKYKNIFII